MLQIVESGRIVVASLHQPSAQMVALLDQCVLLSQGRLLYHGPPGAARDYCMSAGVSCPAGSEIAEHLLSLAKNPLTARILSDLCTTSGVKVESDLIAAAKPGN